LNVQEDDVRALFVDELDGSLGAVSLAGDRNLRIVFEHRAEFCPRQSLIVNYHCLPRFVHCLRRPTSITA
jgi:hypothetical protein